MERSFLAAPLNRPFSGGAVHYVPIRISLKRTAVLRLNVLELELTLTALPDASWIKAFEDNSQLPELNKTSRGTPRIRADKVNLSIRESDLMVAWKYVKACVDHANAVSRRLHSESAGEKRKHP